MSDGRYTAETLTDIETLCASPILISSIIAKQPCLANAIYHFLTQFHGVYFHYLRGKKKTPSGRMRSFTLPHQMSKFTKFAGRWPDL